MSSPITYSPHGQSFFQYLKRRYRKQTTRYCECCKNWEDEGHVEGCGYGNMWADTMKYMQEPEDLSWIEYHFWSK